MARLGPDDVTALTADMAVTLELAGLIPDHTDLAEQVAVHGGRLHGEMQLALRPRYGDLPEPLTEELRSVLVDGLIAELLYLGIWQLDEPEKAWPDEWRRRFEARLAALAAGIDALDGDDGLVERRPVASRSAPRQFTVPEVWQL